MAQLFDNPFEYDSWYDQFPNVFQAELRALQELMPKNEQFLEIGVGTGRFASALKISFGIDISLDMLSLAASRGITSICGDAHTLPFCSASFKGILLVTVTCFLKDPVKAFKEARRVLKPEGQMVLAFINRNSVLGRQIQKNKQNSKYFAEAVFYNEQELSEVLQEAGFEMVQSVNTICKALPEVGPEERIVPGFGAGAFAVIKLRKRPS